jgi:hypothetical protein
MESKIVPENPSDWVEIVTALDSSVVNRDLARRSRLEGCHLNPASPGARDRAQIPAPGRERQRHRA